MLRLTGRGVLDALGGLAGRPPLLVPLAGQPGTVAMLTTPDGIDGDRALNPGNRYPDWQQAVAAELSADHRCVAPTLPLGAHRHAMHADADLSLPGIARLVAELLDRLDLQDVTLVGNDTGGALVQLLMGDGAARVARVVLVSCDAFDNFPPGLTGKTLVLTGKLPPAMFGLCQGVSGGRPGNAAITPPGAAVSPPGSGARPGRGGCRSRPAAGRAW